MTRRLIVLSLVCGLASALGTGSALGWNCPVQIRAAEDAIKRIDYDLDYIAGWSHWSDIKIIAKTCKREFLSDRGV